MLNFCTLFDSFYLSRGLVMYESLKRHTANFHLYIFAFDKLTKDILEELNLDKVTIISLSDFEDDNLLNVKPSRSKAEYCWTCTPSTILYVLENFEAQNCTYIDADLYFYQSPEELIKEMFDANKNILITEHRYNKIAKWRDQKRAGRFCVQFITFTKDDNSLKVLNKWKDQCIDWCFARYEDGKFGDQKYLDTWPKKYRNVHILRNIGGGVAPWNVLQYKFKNINGNIEGAERKTKVKFKLIFYHFHFVRFLSSSKVDLGWNYLPKFALRNIYKPYISEILACEEKMEKINRNYKMNFYFNKKGFKDYIKSLIKGISGFNIVKA